MPEQQPTPLAFPLGGRLPANPYNTFPDVIGEVEVSPAGNAVLRVGQTNRDGHSWHQTAHVVLTPDERETLVTTLASQRETAVPDPAAIVEAATLAAEVLSEAAYDMATTFSCTEAETIAGLFRVLDMPEDADAFLAAHADGDDEGDQHYQDPDSED